MTEMSDRHDRLAARLGRTDAQRLLRDLPVSLEPTIDALLDAGDVLPVSEEPPASLRPRLRQLFADHHRARGSARGDDTVAPTFDSRDREALVGVRGAASGLTLSFDLGGLEVVVDVADRSGDRVLRVVLLGSAAPSWRLELHRLGDGLLETLDAAREAEFSAVPPGEYVLELHHGLERHRLHLDLETDT